MKPPNVKCLNCEKEIYVPKYRLETFKYCSRACKNKANVIRIKANCGTCGNPFEHISSRCNNAKYCSRLCYHRSQKGRGTKKYTCKHCQKEFLSSPSKNRIYCSRKCVNKILKSKFIPKCSTVRKMMMNRGMIEKCEICAYNTVKEILGIHHKDGNRNNNKKENLMVVCPLCHSLIHHKHIVH